MTDGSSAVPRTTCCVNLRAAIGWRHFHMQEPLDGRDSGFNSPTVAMVRLAYAVYLCCAVTAVVCAAYVALAPYANLLVCALAASVAWMLRAWLQEPEQYALIREMFEDVEKPAATPGPPASGVEELISLLRELRQCERLRGTREFDPWTLQAIRSRISALVAADPSLRPLFARSVRRLPDDPS